MHPDLEPLKRLRLQICTHLPGSTVKLKCKTCMGLHSGVNPVFVLGGAMSTTNYRALVNQASRPALWAELDGLRGQGLSTRSVDLGSLLAMEPRSTSWVDLGSCLNLEPRSTGCIDLGFLLALRVQVYRLGRPRLPFGLGAKVYWLSRPGLPIQSISLALAQWVFLWHLILLPSPACALAR